MIRQQIYQQLLSVNRATVETPNFEASACHSGSVSEGTVASADDGKLIPFVKLTKNHSLLDYVN